MGNIREPERVTPVASVFSADERLIVDVQTRLAERLGQCSYISPMLAFSHSDYYFKEMGSNLRRRIFAFESLLDPGLLSDLKHFSNGLEQERAVDGSRRVNIDVGYVSLAKLVLASTKDHAHRLFLGKGIYGEVTLRFVRGHFVPWPWTYPDYASLEYRGIFEEIREIHRRKLEMSNP